MSGLRLAYGRFAHHCKQAAATIAIVGGLATSSLAEETVISVYGDSLVAGYGLQISDGLVPQLQGALDAAGFQTQLINHGISGDTTAGGLARFDWSIDADVDALILSLGANDFLRGLPAEAARNNLDAILANAQQRGIPILLVGFQSPTNWGPDYKAAFDSMYPELSAQYETLLMPFFFAPLVDVGSGTVQLEDFQPDRLHPNARGVAKIVQALVPYVTELISVAKEQ